MCIQVYIYIVWMIHLKNGSTIFSKEKMKEKAMDDNSDSCAWFCVNLCDYDRLSYIQDTV